MSSASGSSAHSACVHCAGHRVFVVVVVVEEVVVGVVEGVVVVSPPSVAFVAVLCAAADSASARRAAPKSGAGRIMSAFRSAKGAAGGEWEPGEGAKCGAYAFVRIFLPPAIQMAGVGLSSFMWLPAAAAYASHCSVRRVSLLYPLAFTSGLSDRVLYTSRLQAKSGDLYPGSRGWDIVWRAESEVRAPSSCFAYGRSPLRVQLLQVQKRRNRRAAVRTLKGKLERERGLSSMNGKSSGALICAPPALPQPSQATLLPDTAPGRAGAPLPCPR